MPERMSGEELAQQSMEIIGMLNAAVRDAVQDVAEARRNPEAVENALFATFLGYQQRIAMAATAGSESQQYITAAKAAMDALGFLKKYKQDAPAPQEERTVEEETTPSWKGLNEEDRNFMEQIGIP